MSENRLGKETSPYLLQHAAQPRPLVGVGAGGAGRSKAHRQADAGVVVMGSPLKPLAVLTLVVGIWLIILGVFEVISAFGIRKAGKDVAAVKEKLTAPPPVQPTG